MSNRVEKLEWLSFIWMYAIVVIHAGIGSHQWFQEFTWDVRIGGVSYFYAVSGYFFAKHFDCESIMKWWRKEISKRFKSLAIPYLIWCAAGLNGWDIFRQFGISTHLPAANFPLWYVKYLFLFCVISPIFVGIINYISRSQYFFSVFLTGAVILPWIPLPLKFAFFFSLFMFSFGFGLALRTKRNHTAVRRSKWYATIPILIAAYVLIHIVGGSVMLQNGFLSWPLRVYSALLLVSLTWCIADCMGEMDSLPSFFRGTFFVYCSHEILLRHMRLFYNLGTAGCFLNGAFVMAVCLAVASVLRRYLNPLYRILSGGR